MNTSSFSRFVSLSSKPTILKQLLPKASSASYSTVSSSSSSTLSSSSRKVLTSRPPTSPILPTLRLTAPTSRTMATTTTTTKLGADALLELMRGRRSYYALSKDLTISKDRIQEIVQEALRQTPSSFNSQSNRVIVLFGDEHDKFWGIVSDTLKGIVPAENWESTEKRMSLFKGAAGSILFFEDTAVVESFQAKFAIYADRFPGWANQTVGMLQFALWTALEAEGLGANLQHYNPLVDEKVAETWKVPATWKLNAQLVFGARAGEANPKDYKPLEETYKVYGA